MKPTTFASSVELRSWLAAHHSTEAELTVAFWKKKAAPGALTYAEALDEALCFGWIDGVRRRLDERRYTIRFSPRRRQSIWSKVNLNHVARLKKQGRMQPAGLKAFEERTAARTSVYSFENKPAGLPPDMEQRFRAAGAARAFFEAQPPGYRRTVLWWVLSAKQPATRDRRLASVMAASAARRRVDLLSPYRALT